MRTKEFLSVRGIEFESVNVHGNPAGMAELARLGARSLPVVSRGDQFIIAQSLNKLAEFVGLDERIKPTLSAAELAARVDLILSRAEGYVRQFPVDAMGRKLANRDRSYRELTHHLFRIPQGFVEAVSQGIEMTHASLVAPPPDDMRTPDQIADYGAAVRRQFADWWQALPDKSGAQPALVYWGPQSLHEVMERTCWHSGQHVRQCMALLEDMGIPPRDKLTAADFAGLPMPEKVWDE